MHVYRNLNNRSVGKIFRHILHKTRHTECSCVRGLPVYITTARILRPWWTLSFTISIVAEPCSKPDISNANISPSHDSIDYGHTYAVSCATGYTISNPALSTLTCEAGGSLSEQPTCDGKLHH